VTARAGGATGLVVLRAESAFAAAVVVVVVVAAARAHAIWDEDGQCWISDAQVAETTYTAFAATRQRSPPGWSCVASPGKPHRAGRAAAGLALPRVPHDTTLSTVDADLTHRAHAVIEQVFADLIDGPLAHLPSAGFTANGAWLSCAAMAHHLLRAAGTLTSRAQAEPEGRPCAARSATSPPASRTAPRHRAAPAHLLALGYRLGAAVPGHPPTPT